MKIYLVLFVLCLIAHRCESLLIGAWNSDRLGIRKMSNELKAVIFSKIVSRYDILFFNEVTDTSSVYELLDMVNDLLGSESKMAVTISQKLGRTDYTEYFVYFYRSDKVVLEAASQYPDNNDWFERPPFIVVLSPKRECTRPHKIAFIGINTKHTDARSELSHLHDVYTHTLDIFGEQGGVMDVALLGDFNADCSRAAENHLTGIDQCRSDFLWVIDTNNDTTTKYYMNCAYDRIVFVGKHLVNAYVSESGGIYDFLTAYAADLTGKSDNYISDHYPVECRMNVEKIPCN